MTNYKLLNKSFMNFLSLILAITTGFPFQICAKEKEKIKDNSTYRIQFQYYFNKPFDGSNQSGRYYKEENYPYWWYNGFDPQVHVEEVDMTLAAEQAQDFIISAQERIKVNSIYHDLVNEIFFRSAMMFRLAHNGYSSAYVKELEQIFFRLADLDAELKKNAVDLETRKSELDRVIEGAFLTGIEELRSKSPGVQVKPTINEVLTTIADFSDRGPLRSTLRKKYNDLDRWDRRNVGLIIYGVLLLCSLVGLDTVDLDQILEISRGKILLATTIASVPLSRYASKLLLPLKFKRSQKYIFDRASQKCSDLLSDSGFSSQREGETK